MPGPESAITFEWDPNKNAANRAKHGIDFETACLIWEGPTLTKPDERDYGEVRFIAVGEIDSRAVVVVFTWRGETTRRLISARKANRDEREDYRKAIERGETDPPD